MAPDSIVECQVHLQAQLFTFLKGMYDDLEPYWYKTVEGGDIDVSSLPLLLGITDVQWHNFAVAAGIARVKKECRGGLQFKRDVFLQLLKDYKIDTDTTLMWQKEWKPCKQLMVQIGSRDPRPSLKSHLQNPHAPSTGWEQTKDLMSDSTVKILMETSILFPHKNEAAGVNLSTTTTEQEVVTKMMGNLSIDTDRSKVTTITSQLLTVPTGTVVITPMNEPNKDFFSGWSSMERSRLLPHRPTVTTEASSSEQLWTSRLVSPESHPTQAGKDKTFRSCQVTVGVKEK